MTLKSNIELAIATERLGANIYEHFATKFKNNENVKQIFERLAKDELIHESQFKELLEKMDDEGPDANEEDISLLKAFAISKFFNLDLLGDAEKIETTSDALAMAADLEKETLLFFQSLKDVFGDNGILDTIIAAEKRHFVTITKVLISEAKYRGTEDSW